MTRAQLREQLEIERQWRVLAWEAGSEHCWPMLTISLLERFWRAYG